MDAPEPEGAVRGGGLFLEACGRPTCTQPHKFSPLRLPHSSSASSLTLPLQLLMVSAMQPASAGDRGFKNRARGFTLSSWKLVSKINLTKIINHFIFSWERAPRIMKLKNPGFARKLFLVFLIESLGGGGGGGGERPLPPPKLTHIADST